MKNVTQPTITLYSPTEKNTGVAVVVFPGGGFEGLAIDLEGTEVCDWLTSRGITCVLLKYRVPSMPYDWHCKCRPNHGLNKSTLPLEDAQRTIGLVRSHAAEWHIDPHKVGVLGFSAGGYLVAEISTDFAHRLYKPIDAADKESFRPDFAVEVYPGHLSTSDTTYKLNPVVQVTPQTSPTFLVQAEDDYIDGVDQSLAYYIALQKAKVPTEMHLYANGGHAFGLRHTTFPITDWPRLVEKWLATIGSALQLIAAHARTTYRALTQPILLRDDALEHRALVRLGRSARGQKLCSVLQTRRSQDYGFKPPTV